MKVGEVRWHSQNKMESEPVTLCSMMGCWSYSWQLSPWIYLCSHHLKSCIIAVLFHHWEAAKLMRHKILQHKYNQSAQSHDTVEDHLSFKGHSRDAESTEHRIMCKLQRNCHIYIWTSICRFLIRITWDCFYKFTLYGVMTIWLSDDNERILKMR